MFILLCITVHDKNSERPFKTELTTILILIILFKYLDGVLAINNPEFLESTKEIYPKNLALKNDRTSFLDLD